MSEDRNHSQYITVPPESEGQRLDRFLGESGVPFALVQKLARKRALRVDGKRAKADTRLAAGQEVRIPVIEDRKHTTEKSLSAEDTGFIRSLVIYEDPDILALNKPAGLATQGGTGIKRHLDGMLDALIDPKNEERPRLVHRLDKDTSGVLLLARHAAAARALGGLFKDKDIRKIYWALTVPAPEMNDGEILVPIRKAGGAGKEKMIADPENGQNARTLFKVVERAGKTAAFVAFWPRTGRTHQIRVHAAYMGCPILGDGKYGGQAAFLEGMEDTLADRVHLHARTLAFRHPLSGKAIEITAPLPDELQRSWDALGFHPTDATAPFSDISA